MRVLPSALRSVSPSELAERLQAERRGNPFLLHLDAAGNQQIVDLDASRGTLSIGRQPSTDIALTWDTEVSRVHAVLERVGGSWTLSDDSLSRNGSYVNGRRVHGRQVLTDGDSITIGRTLLVFRCGALGEGARTTDVTANVDPQPLSPAQLRVLEALCRPVDDRFGFPPSNRELAEQLFLSVDTVKGHLRELSHAFGIPDLPQNRKRAELVRRAYECGLVRPSAP